MEKCVDCEAVTDVVCGECKRPCCCPIERWTQASQFAEWLALCSACLAADIDCEEYDDIPWPEEDSPES